MWQDIKHSNIALIEKLVGEYDVWVLEKSPYGKFKIKIFQSYDEEWLDYVGKCRKRTQDGLFDLVEGGIANDKVFNTIDLYFSGAMGKDDALGRLAFEHPNHQLCILNQEIINRHLHFISVKEITTGGTDHESR